MRAQHIEGLKKLASEDELRAFQMAKNCPRRRFPWNHSGKRGRVLPEELCIVNYSFIQDIFYHYSGNKDFVKLEKKQKFPIKGASTG